MELYIHIPFCIKKCAYCDFLSFENQFSKVESYINALNLDIKNGINELYEPVTSVFIGGGTPSAIDAKYIVDIMNTVYETYTVLNDAEITIEVNPCSVELSKLKTYKNAGINRISMGVQSFNDATLKILGRAHDSATACNAIKLIKEAGFDNFSLDLISCVPGESKEAFFESLDKAISFNPKHLSVYQLIIEEGTKFYDLFGPESDFERDLDNEAYIYEETIEKLKIEGFTQYEISNFSKEGFESKHNSGYWELTPYMGFGLGATGYYNGKRVKKANALDDYIDSFNNGIETELINIEDIQTEYIMMGMRMNKGISEEEYFKRFSMHVPKNIVKVFEKYSPEYVNIKDGRYSFTTKGMLVSNTILAEII